MSAWPTQRLGDLCEITIGKTPPRDEPRYWGAGHAWLSISDMGQERMLEHTRETVTPAAVRDGVSGRLVSPGTVLLSFKLSIGKLGIAAEPLYTNEAIAALAIRDRAQLAPEYLLHALAATDLQRGSDRAVMGSTLNKTKLSNLRVPVPPFPEQRRIAAILDKADAVRRKRQQTLDLADQFLRSAFVHMVGPLAADYPDWPETTIRDLAAAGRGSIRTGPFGSDLHHSEFVDAGVAVLGIDNAVQNRFAWGQRRFVTQQKYEGLRRYTVHPGDVIITIMGTTGRAAVVPEDIPLAITTKHLVSITPNRMVVEPEFLAHAIHSHPAILGQIEQANRGAIMSGLNKTLVAGLRLHLPPLAIQASFAGVLSATRSAVRKATGGLELSRDLFGSLVQRAFRGEL